MKIYIENRKCIATKEKGDKRFTSSEWGSAESQLLYHIKKQLNTKGFDLIKKRMGKDGHLVDERQLYLRSRNPKSPKPHIYIWNGNWAIEDAGEVFNKEGEYIFHVDINIFKGE